MPTGFILQGAFCKRILYVYRFSMSQIQNSGKDAEKEDGAMSTGSSEHPTEDSDEDALIWPPRRKKRRKMVYLNFSKVAETFPDTSTDVVFQFAEMVTNI